MQVLAHGDLLLSIGNWHKGATLERYHLVTSSEGRPLALLEGAREKDSQVAALSDEHILYFGPSGMSLYDRNGRRIAELPLAPSTISTLTGKRYRIEAVASDGRLLFAGTPYAPASARDSFFVLLPETADPAGLARQIDAQVAAHKKLLRKP
jgi:hypothetical protein